MPKSVAFKTISTFVIITIILVSATSSCKSKKTTSIDKADTTEQVKVENNDGLKSATIVDYSTRNDACHLLIHLEDGSILQPINIPEDLRKDGTKVWVSFSYSKRQLGPCPFGSPITIDSIKIKK